MITDTTLDNPVAHMPRYKVTSPNGREWVARGDGTATMLRNSGHTVELVSDRELDTLAAQEVERRDLNPAAGVLDSVIYEPLTLPSFAEFDPEVHEVRIIGSAPEIPAYEPQPDPEPLVLDYDLKEALDRAAFEAMTVPELRKYARQVHEIKGARIMTRQPLIEAILAAQAGE